MIVVDVEIPKNCGECPLLNACASKFSKENKEREYGGENCLIKGRAIEKSPEENAGFDEGAI